MKGNRGRTTVFRTEDRIRDVKNSVLNRGLSPNPRWSVPESVYLLHQRFCDVECLFGNQEWRGVRYWIRVKDTSRTP